MTRRSTGNIIAFSKPLIECDKKHYYSGVVCFFFKCLGRLGLLKFEKIAVSKE